MKYHQACVTIIYEAGLYNSLLLQSKSENEKTEDDDAYRFC